MGPSAFLAPEHKAVLTADAEKARAIGRKGPRSISTWPITATTGSGWGSPRKRRRQGSDRLIDAVVAYGTPEAIAARLKEHLDAGADHVPVQILTKDENLVPALAELAGPLGLKPARKPQGNVMTEGVSLKADLGRYGVWLPSRSVSAGVAKQIEALGYGAVWVGGSPDADLDWVEPALAETSTLQLATGIINIWASPAAEVATSFDRIESAYPGRFLLGVGVGHPEHTDVYRNPTTRSSSTSTRWTVPRCRPVAGCSPPSARKCWRSPPNAARALTRT